MIVVSNCLNCAKTELIRDFHLVYVVVSLPRSIETYKWSFIIPNFNQLFLVLIIPKSWKSAFYEWLETYTSNCHNLKIYYKNVINSTWNCLFVFFVYSYKLSTKNSIILTELFRLLHPTTVIINEAKALITAIRRLVIVLIKPRSGSGVGAGSGSGDGSAAGPALISYREMAKNNSTNANFMLKTLMSIIILLGHSRLK